MKLLLVLLVVFSGTAAFGRQCIVTNATDNSSSSCGLSCSLREAVQDTSCDIITFQRSNLVFSTIVLTHGELSITRPLSILGIGADELTVSANSLSRVFYVGAPATISNLTISGGNGTGVRVTGPGGAIVEDVGGSLVLDYVHVTQSTTSGLNSEGGGVFLNANPNVIRNSTFSANTATGLGGGVMAQGGQLKIINSTFGNNTASNGGGVALRSTSALIRSSTFYGNSGNATLLVSANASALFGNSIVETVQRDVASASATSEGHNLLRSAADSTGNPVSYDQSDIFSSTFILNALQRFRGPLPVFPLPDGSVAVDSGSNELANTLPIRLDQTGRNRFYDGNNDGVGIADIGAVEYNIDPVPPSGAVIYGRVFNSNGRPLAGARVSYVTQEGDVSKSVTSNPAGYFHFGGPAGRYCNLSATYKNRTYRSQVVFSYPNRENVEFVPN